LSKDSKRIYRILKRPKVICSLSWKFNCFRIQFDMLMIYQYDLLAWTTKLLLGSISSNYFSFPWPCKISTKVPVIWSLLPNKANYAGFVQICKLHFQDNLNDDILLLFQVVSSTETLYQSHYSSYGAKVFSQSAGWELVVVT